MPAVRASSSGKTRLRPPNRLALGGRASRWKRQDELGRAVALVDRYPGSDASSELMTLGSDAEVYVWNVGERRCVKRWREEGGYGTTVMSGDANGRYLCIG